MALNTYKKVTHRDNRINDDKDNVRDTGHDGGNDTANGRDDGTLRQVLITLCYKNREILTIVDGGCDLVVRKGRGFVKT